MAKSQKLLVIENRSHLTNEEKKQKTESSVEVENKPKLIKAPKYLNRKMKLKFNELAKELQEAKIFTHLDVDVLAIYCYNLYFYEDVSEKLLKLDDGSEEFEKLSKQQKHYFLQIEPCRKELGIGFYSRSKFQLPASPKKKESKFDKLRKAK